jgi:hypothetical protein
MIKCVILISLISISQVDDDMIRPKEYNPAGTPGYRNGTESFFDLKRRPPVVRDVEIHNQPVLRMRRK